MLLRRVVNDSLGTRAFLAAQESLRHASGSSTRVTAKSAGSKKAEVVKKAAKAPPVVKKEPVKKEEKVVKTKTKRPLSAYSLFMRNEYAKLKVAVPGKTFSEMSRRLADLWKDLPDNEKAKYLREAEKAYAVQKAQKLPMPPNAYAIFAKEHFQLVKKKFPNLPFVEVSKKVGEMWRHLPELEKEARKKRHGLKMAEYKKQMKQEQ